MRVLIDTTYARRAPYSGTAIYLRRLQHALAELPDLAVIGQANRRRRPPAGGGLGSIRNLLADTWWSGLELPRLARANGAAVIHHPIPTLSRLTSTPQVITVLDLAFERLPDHFDSGYRAYAHRIHRAAARRADAVVCISETTAADVRELWGVGSERIVVAPLGPGQELTRIHTVAEPRHFLYVGDSEPRKNLNVLLEAYADYRERVSRPLELVLAGSATADGAGITVMRSPDSGTLSQLYEGAVALVHPSLYEGFGLTPLEAMAIGTPVIAARSPGIVEVCAQAVAYADPHDPSAFAAAMVEVAGDDALRDDLRARGLARAQEFSWARCASRHLEAYSLALNG
jgi:glycosyltransferase involved in cell wall biosynthesis